MPGSDTTITANCTRNDADGGSDIPSANGSTILVINGADYAIGHENRNGSNTTATAEQNRLTDEIAGASGGSGVLFPISANSNVTAQLVVRNIEDVAKKDMTLTVRTGNISYHLDTTAVDTEAIMEALGTADAGNITFSVGISNSSAVAEGATLVVSPVEFTITCTYDSRTVTVDTFGSFVSRSVEATAEEAAQITTAVVVAPDGSPRQVPTKVIQETDSNGTIHYYAVINSLTNSTYALIQNTVELTDAAASWAKNAINDMGSRRSVTGTGDNNYEPDRDVTRAEVAVMVQRLLQKSGLI